MERLRAGMRGVGVRNIFQRYLHLGNVHRSGVGFSQLKRYGDGNLRGRHRPRSGSSTFNVMPPPSIVTTNLPTATPNYIYNTTLRPPAVCSPSIGAWPAERYRQG